MTKLPFVNDTLKDIDTRQLFVSGIVTMIRLIAMLALALGAVVLLAATVKAFGGERAEGGFDVPAENNIAWTVEPNRLYKPCGIRR